MASKASNSSKAAKNSNDTGSGVITSMADARFVAKRWARNDADKKYSEERMKADRDRLVDFAKRNPQLMEGKTLHLGNVDVTVSDVVTGVFAPASVKLSVAEQRQVIIKRLDAMKKLVKTASGKSVKIAIDRNLLDHDDAEAMELLHSVGYMETCMARWAVKQAAGKNRA